MNPGTLESVRRVVGRVAGRAPDTVDADAPLFRGGLELSSVQGVELLAAVEQEFEISIAFADLSLESLSTVRTLCRFVESQRAPEEQARPQPLRERTRTARAAVVPPAGSSSEPDTSVLERVAAATSLREGPEGVATILRLVHADPGAPLREIARRARLPLPVCSAVRRELERAGLLTRGAGLALAPGGETFVTGTLGIHTRHDSGCPTCAGSRVVIAPELRATVAELERHLDDCPPLDVTLDQAPATAETSLRRALAMYAAGAVEGRRLVVLGDDDLVSVAVALLGRALGRPDFTRRLVVVELDERRVAHLGRLSAAHGLGIECVRHDLRDPLPRALTAAFDTFETDPSYTLAGVEMFVSRGVAALDPKGGGQGFLSYAQRAPKDQLELTRALTRMGLAIQEVVPAFNRYRGATLLGNISQWIQLGLTPDSAPIVRERFAEPIYSGEAAPTLRLYRCVHCRAETRVGAGAGVPTIEALKLGGCSRCGRRAFRLVGRE